MSHLFISYSKEDRAFVSRLADCLIKAGYDIWFDDRIDYGERWSEALFRSVETCATFIVVMTPTAYASDAVLRECHYAQGCRRLTIPLLYKGEVFPLYTPELAIPVDDNDPCPFEFQEHLTQVLSPLPRQGENIAPPTAKIATHRLNVAPTPSFLPDTTHIVTVLQGPTPDEAFELTENHITLGRSLENGITINDGEISRFHCRFVRVNEGFLLEDLGSTNGTFINGKYVADASLLYHGDIIALGKTVTLVYEIANGDRTSRPGAQSPTQVLSKKLSAEDKGIFVVVYNGDVVEQILRLDKDFITIGRVDSNDIQVDHGGVSRFHCVLTARSGRVGYTVDDLGSTNGTYINGARWEQTTELKDGDLVGVGDKVILAYKVIL